MSLSTSVTSEKLQFCDHSVRDLRILKIYRLVLLTMVATIDSMA